MKTLWATSYTISLHSSHLRREMYLYVTVIWYIIPGKESKLSIRLSLAINHGRLFGFHADGGFRWKTCLDNKRSQNDGLAYNWYLQRLLWQSYLSDGKLVCSRQKDICIPVRREKGQKVSTQAEHIWQEFMLGCDANRVKSEHLICVDGKS